MGDDYPGDELYAAHAWVTHHRVRNKKRWATKTDTAYLHPSRRHATRPRVPAGGDFVVLGAAASQQAASSPPPAPAQRAPGGAGPGAQGADCGDAPPSPTRISLPLPSLLAMAALLINFKDGTGVAPARVLTAGIDEAIGRSFVVRRDSDGATITVDYVTLAAGMKAAMPTGTKQVQPKPELVTLTPASRVSLVDQHLTHPLLGQRGRVAVMGYGGAVV